MGQVFTIEPKNGTPKSLVLFLHGYGANGQDLISIGHEWQAQLPNTVFISADAPEPCAMNPFGGFQWFDLTMRDPTEYWRGVNKAAPYLNKFIDEQLKAYGLGDEALGLVGFSQGTMMALHVGLRREKAPAAIVGYSGKLAGPEHLAKEMTVKPPVLLVHGDVDEVIPVAALSEAETALREAKVEVRSHISRGLGHGIDLDGLRLGSEHLTVYLK